jgi:hypothetical protein
VLWAIRQLGSSKLRSEESEDIDMVFFVGMRLLSMRDFKMPIRGKGAG